jgi:hypothetical protein
MVLEGGGSGNVFAYNYSKNSQGNVGDHWLFPDMITHGAHPYMNLFEGNRGVKLNFDNYWGSSSHNTAFRNWIERRSDPPDDYINSGIWAVDIQANSNYQNIVGNIIGYPGCTGTIWRFGYICPSGGENDPAAENTLIRHGNYDYVTETVQWDSNISDRILPNSLYLSSKPSFFGSLPWPPFGPDLNPITNDLPAQLRFEGRDIPTHLGDTNNDDGNHLQVKDCLLSQNYPNPFNPATTIKYSIPVYSRQYAVGSQNNQSFNQPITKSNSDLLIIQLKVYNILGKEVATLVNESQRPGDYEVKWDARHLSSGVYFYQLKAGNFIRVKKLILMK